jgi:formate hydrogenlyase transcriptional activator
VSSSTSREVLTDAELQRAHDDNLRAALDETGWKIYGPGGGAAELLGMKPTTLTARIKKAGLRRPNR